MTSEDIKKIAQEEMAKQIKENIDSALIFKYVSDLEAEIEKKDTLIHTMQAEFERLENLEDNTEMLKMELQEKNKIIDGIAKYIGSLDIDEDICKKVDNPCKDYAGENKKTCEDCIKEYFKKKCKGE